ncbi:MAG TPA: hypothetical protein VF678_09835 [bacterium]
MMIFERAINDAATMFLFDRRSQQKLEEMAEAAEPRSRDQFLIRLTHAAFAYYNAAEGLASEVQGVIRQVLGVLREVKQYREDRVFYTLALKLEVDVRMHLAALTYSEMEKDNREQPIFSDEDGRALSICDTLLKNFPASFDPLPAAWFSGLVPLFPPFRDLIVEFYKQRGREHRQEPLAKILVAVRNELVVAAGMLSAKKFMNDFQVPMKARHAVRTYLHTPARIVATKLGEDMPPGVVVASDIALPRGIGQGQIDAAIDTVQGHIGQARGEKDVRRFTGSLLQLGILNFLRENAEDTVKALVQTLKATRHINPEDKKIRQYRHEEFPDIPFMVGTAFLRIVVNSKHVREREQMLLEKGRSALLRALMLQPRYHQAYVNLMLSLYLGGEPEGDTEVVRAYLSQFGNDLTQVDAVAFRNHAFMQLHGGNGMTADVAKLLILSKFCMGGQLTKGKKMLQELKTLYVLNAHDHTIQYQEAYRNAFRMKDEEFIADIADDALHSAMLFYMAHAFTSLSLVPGKYDAEIGLDHVHLNQGVDLNCEALFFNPKNSSALRLVDTQVQILQFAMQRTEKRWENINNTMGQRFQYYEDYLRQDKSYKLLKERLTNLKLDNMVPELKVAQNVLLKMDGSINLEQRARLKQRVQAT